MTTHTQPSGSPAPRTRRDTAKYVPRSPRPWLERVDAAGATSQGRKRKRNEDNFIVAELHRHLRVADTSLDELRFGEPTQAIVLAVADGVGGHGDGQAASAKALESALRYLFDRAPSCGAIDGTTQQELRLTVALEAAFRHAQDAMVEHARAHGLDPRLGTTLTLAYLVARRAYLCHVGDSRAYRSRRGQLQQLTHDDTLAEQLREEQRTRRGDGDGAFAEEPLTGVLRRFEHVLSHAVGGGADTSLDVELRRCSLRSGDRLLLCSDGLTAHVDDAGIARCLEDDALDARGCVEVLVRAANAGGGSDNVTAVVARVR